MVDGPPNIPGADDVLEFAAQLIEEASILDMRGVWAKRKRQREDAELRYAATQESRREMAAHIRAFKSRADLTPEAILAQIAEHGETYPYLRSAWPLAWKGWVNIICRIKCNSNCIPSETEYRVEITEEGRTVLAAAGMRETVG